MIILDKLPLCPSQNAQLTMSFKQKRFIKTSKARDFDNEMFNYSIKFNKIIENAKNWINPKDILKVDCYFVFHKSRLISQKKELKRIDSDNRLKSTRDAISKLLDYDDKYFVTGIVERCYCEDIKDEQAIVIITKSSLKSYDDLKERFKL